MTIVWPLQNLGLRPTGWGRFSESFATRQTGVAFVKAYSDAALTKDESQLQHLLLIVARHREDIPIQSKDAVLKNIIM